MENVLLKQLGKDQLDELIKRYYSSEKVVDLIREYELNVKVAELVKLFPLKVLKELECPYCFIPLKQRLPFKTRPKSIAPVPFCDKCDHREKEGCICQFCLAIKKAKNDQLDFDYQKQILSIQYIEKNKTSLFNLSLKEAFYLVGLCRVGRHLDSDLISALYFNDSKLSPTSLMDDEVLSSLYIDKFLDISISTMYGVIDFENKKSAYIWDSIEWRLNFSNDKSINIDLIEKLEKILRNKELWPELWHFELLEIWKELALHECLGYMKVHFEEHGFEFHVGKKTIQVLIDALENFSISKCYYFIWVEVRSAASYLVRENISRRQAANSIIGRIQRKVERALSEKWDIKDYFRSSKCEESLLTALFSNVITNLNDDFLKVTPNDQILGISEK